jgi:L-iditol 2-dehydrogenase
LTVAVLKLSGAGRIWAVDPVSARRELALALGADAVLDPTAAPAGREVLRETGGRGVDVAIDCAAQGDSLDHAVAALRSAGRLIVTGIPSEARVSLDFNTIRRKELAIFNVRRSNRESETALELLRDHRACFARLITYELPIEQIQRAFQILERYEDGVGKIVIRLD